MGRFIRTDFAALGAQLRTLRQAAGLSQERLAQRMTELAHDGNPRAKAVSLEWVRRVEHGTVKSVDTERLALAARVLGVAVSELLPPTTRPDRDATLTTTEIALALRGHGVPEDVVARILHEIEQYQRPSE